MGTFISADPAMDGLNWYTYCANNPMNYVDPWGLEPISSSAAKALADAINGWSPGNNPVIFTPGNKGGVNNGGGGGSTGTGKAKPSDTKPETLGDQQKADPDDVTQETNNNDHDGPKETGPSGVNDFIQNKRTKNYIGYYNDLNNTDEYKEFTYDRRGIHPLLFGMEGTDYGCTQRFDGNDYNPNWFHKGIDVVNRTRVVVASKSGTVLHAGRTNNNGLGVAVMVKNNDGSISIYGHMDENSISHLKKGDVVFKGDKIGRYAKPTVGNSEGPHLHYQEVVPLRPIVISENVINEMDWAGYGLSPGEINRGNFKCVEPSFNY